MKKQKNKHSSEAIRQSRNKAEEQLIEAGKKFIASIKNRIVRTCNKVDNSMIIVEWEQWLFKNKLDQSYAFFLKDNESRFLK